MFHTRNSILLLIYLQRPHLYNQDLRQLCIYLKLLEMARQPEDKTEIIEEYRTGSEEYSASSIAVP